MPQLSCPAWAVTDDPTPPPPPARWLHFPNVLQCGLRALYYRAKKHIYPPKNERDEEGQGGRKAREGGTESGLFLALPT